MILLGLSFYNTRVRYLGHVWKPVDASPCKVCERCKRNADKVQRSRRARECKETMVVIQRVDKALSRVWVHRDLFPSQYLPEIADAEEDPETPDE